MIWEKSGDTAMRCAPWTVAKVKTNGVFFYELWHDKQPEMVGRYASFAVAKFAAADIEMEGQA